MATDPNKKTLRHFQCRDYLWETFEQMSGELECSVDYLINEAMRQYARSRNYGTRGPSPSMVPGAADSSPPTVPTAPAPTPPSNRPGPQPRPPALPPMPPVPTRPGSGPKIPTLPGSGAPRPPAMPPMPGRPPGVPSASAMPAIRPPAGGMPPLPPPNVGRAPSVPPVQTGAPPKIPPLPNAGAARPSPGTGGTLYAIYQGEQYPVTKDEFIIGRGQKSSDLVIRDSNVSRRHAVVVLHNGQYWMVDQQSTNGVEYMGAKIDRKRIEDGDVFKICDYEITFAYR